MLQPSVGQQTACQMPVPLLTKSHVIQMWPRPRGKAPSGTGTPNISPVVSNAERPHSAFMMVALADFFFFFLQNKNDLIPEQICKSMSLPLANLCGIVSMS